MSYEGRSFTPREIVSELDRFIVGQKQAKKAVAIALRNRWRRQHVDKRLQDEILPKNIIMIGPTGCGKTEIARRLAKLAHAPFVKVEATKFTEVGYVGRDVDSMVRDLVECAVKMCREQALTFVKSRAAELAEERVLDLLLPPPHMSRHMPFDIRDVDEHKVAEEPRESSEAREKMRTMLREGKFDNRDVSVDVTQAPSMPMMHMFGQAGMEEMAGQIQDALQGAFGRGNKKKKKVKIPEAMEILQAEEAQRLIDMDQVQKEAVTLAEQSGIIFIDEIDKIAKADGAKSGGPDVSREGVQRDILPIVEGSTVSTKYGFVKTDHILFIAAGAFHMSKPSDLIPELQGRFPIRVELDSLREEDFVRILTEPENSLVKQYTALLKTENVTLTFEEGGIRGIAAVAFKVNSSQENIGARRLYTVMEKLLEEESFTASDNPHLEVVIDRKLVDERLSAILENEDLSKYIL